MQAPAISRSESSGFDPNIPTTSASSSGLPEGEAGFLSRTASARYSFTNHLTARRNRCVVQLKPFWFNTRTTSSQGWSGRIRRTVGRPRSSRLDPRVVDRRVNLARFTGRLRCVSASENGFCTNTEDINKRSFVNVSCGTEKPTKSAFLVDLSVGRRSAVQSESPPVSL